MATKKKPAPRSLTQFVQDKKRADCPVCALNPDIRAEIQSARTKKIKRETVLEWLRAECGIAINSADFDRHHSARHERDE